MKPIDLILWRHAEAEDLDETDETGGGDLSRRLTVRGEKQAARMAAWLDRQLPESTKIWSSPAVRTEQTTLALGRKYRLSDALGPNGSVEDLLGLVQWPKEQTSTLVVGHQPTLGRVVSQLLQLSEPECAIRKGSVWWLRRREKHSQFQTILLSVQVPDLL